MNDHILLKNQNGMPKVVVIDTKVDSADISKDVQDVKNVKNDNVNMEIAMAEIAALASRQNENVPIGEVGENTQKPLWFTRKGGIEV